MWDGPESRCAPRINHKFRQGQGRAVEWKKGRTPKKEMKTDVNYASYADERDITIEHQVIDAPEPQKYDDILKLSNCRSVLVRNCWINKSGGNREDGIDIMRFSDDVVIRDCIVNAGNLYAVTIKGGSQNIHLDDVTIAIAGGWPCRVDIDIGNYSHTVPFAKTGQVYLTNVFRGDGSPVRVRVGNAVKPIVIGGNVKILFWQSLALKFWVWVNQVIYRLKQ